MFQRQMGAWAIVLGVLVASSADAAVTLGTALCDHMVVQRDKTLPVWGMADAGEKVTVSFRGASSSTVADAKGQWCVDVSAGSAGGPFVMEVVGTNTIKIQDVLVGEVWLASGQSNMAMQVASSLDADREITSATRSEIRQFYVPNVPKGEPVEVVGGQWVACSPQTVGAFSAVAYFFARELNEKLGVPVGIINSSWGGTCAEAWTPMAALKAEKLNPSLVTQYEQVMADYEGVLKKHQEAEAKSAQLRKEGKLLDRQVDPGNKGLEQGWAKSDFKDADWKSVELPNMLDGELGGDGAIWVRREVTIPETWANQELQLCLGTIDDYEVTYWNGEQIGKTDVTTPNAWCTFRKYAVPAKLVAAGRAVIAVRVFDDFCGGGFTGHTRSMALVNTTTKESLPLSGAWRYKVEVTLDPANLTAVATGPMFGPDNPNAPATLYNGMIWPLKRYPIRGAIWYQGESNTGNPGAYCELLSTMIREWRKTWGIGEFPFGIVQLANFMGVQTDANAASSWAVLREAQTRTAQTVANVGQAVIIDIGDAVDIHPKNKQDVGKRLGLWALATTYAQKIEYSGPTYSSMTVEGSRVVLTFDHVAGGLIPRNGLAVQGFAVAGKDEKFVWADEVVVEGNTVTVSAKAVLAPVAVRYGWADNPTCNLYNDAGLPAVPFRTDAW